MKTGKTKTGFEFEIFDDALDDYELLEELSAMDEGKINRLPKVLERLLGADQTIRLKEHIRDTSGRVSASRLVEELGEIMTSDTETKNS